MERQGEDARIPCPNPLIRQEAPQAARTDGRTQPPPGGPPRSRLGATSREGGAFGRERPGQFEAPCSNARSGAVHERHSAALGRPARPGQEGAGRKGSRRCHRASLEDCAGRGSGSLTREFRATLPSPKRRSLRNTRAPACSRPPRPRSPEPGRGRRPALRANRGRLRTVPDPL